MRCISCGTYYKARRFGTWRSETLRLITAYPLKHSIKGDAYILRPPLPRFTLSLPCMLYSLFLLPRCAAFDRFVMESLHVNPTIILPCAADGAGVPAMAADTPTYGEKLEGFDYGWPVKHFTFTSQNQSLDMAYLDVKPEKANGRTVVLMHGKNFCAGTWDGTIRALTASGYRVIAPDQIGFCKSIKPERYQYTFQQLADNTHALLTSLGVERVTVIGHSTGGMLATRYALMWPQQVEQLVMVNPIGLEDWKARGVPHITVDQWYQRELKTSADGIRQYEKNTYYAGEWKPEYERWVTMLAGLNNGPGKARVAWKLGAALRHDLHPAGCLRI